MGVFEKDGYENETFAHVEWQGDLEGVEFYNCLFAHSSFQACRLIGCSFDNCTFVQSNLSLVEIMNTSFLDTRFSECKMIGIAWSAVGGLLSAAYEGCNLNNNIFSDMNLTKFRFTSCSLEEASFQHTKLWRAVFDDCDLARCRFTQADLSFADFTTSRNYFMDAENNTLHKTRFSLPEALSLLDNLDIVIS